MLKLYAYVSLLLGVVALLCGIGIVVFGMTALRLDSTLTALYAVTSLIAGLGSLALYQAIGLLIATHESITDTLPAQLAMLDKRIAAIEKNSVK